MSGGTGGGFTAEDAENAERKTEMEKMIRLFASVFLSALPESSAVNPLAQAAPPASRPRRRVGSAGVRAGARYP